MSQFQLQKTNEKTKKSKTNLISNNYFQQSKNLSHYDKENLKKKNWELTLKKIGFSYEYLKDCRCHNMMECKCDDLKKHKCDNFEECKFNNLGEFKHKHLRECKYDSLEEYYENYPVKPGTDFWNQLANYHNSLHKLDIRIPDTLVILGNNNYQYLYYDEEKRGIFRKNELDVTINDFENICKNKMDPRYMSEEKDYYLMVYRKGNKNCPNEISKTVYTNTSWKSYKSSSCAFQPNSLLQQFVYPKSKNASIVRFCYKTHNYSQQDSSYGFKITNNIQIDSNDHRKKLSEKATLCKEAQNSFQVTNMSSVAIQPFIEPSSKLVKFLEKAFQIRIEEIVLDYVQDYKQRNVLFNVKFIKIKKTKKKIKKFIQTRKQNLNELSCSVYCKLCGLLFKKDEASKTLTYKLLWEFCKHLKKRGEPLNDIDFNHSSTRPCRVCDLCYMAVVSEHELIELEQQFALMQNIPIRDLYQKVPAEKPAKNRPALLKSNLKQWRLMIYLKELQFSENQYMVYQKLKKPFYILLKLSSINTTFKVQLKDNISLGDNINFQLQILRVFYFFSEQLDIEEFLNGSQIEIQFSQKTDWENHLAHGSSKTISKFKHNTPSGQKHEAQVYMFFQNQEVASLKLIVGLVNDGEHNTSQMNMYKHQNVYFPDNDFYNCNNFPKEWIEIFQEDSKTKYKKDDSLNNKEDFDGYSPFCTKHELKKMLKGQSATKSSMIDELRKYKRGQQDLVQLELKGFRNTSNLFQTARNENYTLKQSNQNESTTYAKTRQASAYPNLLQHKKKTQQSSYIIRTKAKENDQKPQSSINPKTHNQKMQRWFSTKLKEEDELYKDYLTNLKKHGIIINEDNQKEEQDLINKYFDKSKQEIEEQQFNFQKINFI